jgi:hypothetical protein
MHSTAHSLQDAPMSLVGLNFAGMPSGHLPDRVTEIIENEVPSLSDQGFPTDPL